MPDEKMSPTETAQILQAIGRLSGQMEMVIGLHREQSKNIDSIRAEIRDQEARFSSTVAATEKRLSEKIDASLEPVHQRIDGLSSRVTSLENEDKRLIEKVAKVSAIGGSISAGLVTAGVELVKRLGS